MIRKTAYVCGPLTNLSPENAGIKVFYERIADLYKEITGIRAFVPHEHFDPVKNAKATPGEVYIGDMSQITDKSSLMIVVAAAPSWGGGMEVERAHWANIPVILLCEKKQFEQKRISRILLGSPAIRYTIIYENEEKALELLRTAIQNHLHI